MTDESKKWSSRFLSSLWSETDRTWEDKGGDWRIVGSNPFLDREGNDNKVISKEYLHIIEFPSLRLDIGYNIDNKIKKNAYVILEADRGEDCGKIKGYTTRKLYEELIQKHKNSGCDDFKLKKIYREASSNDLNKLEEIQQMNKEALKQCYSHLLYKKLNMEVINCEYQFDLKKITFFYKSNERIDFRELVKELYKIFKTRIWMCSIDKSKDKLLKEIICD